MPFLLGPLVGWLFPKLSGAASKAIGVLIEFAILAAIAAIAWFSFWGWVHGREQAASAAVIAEMQKATAAEHDRRVQVEQYMQQWATGSIARVDELNGKVRALQAKAARLSAAHDKESCWLPDATARMREMGQ